MSLPRRTRHTATPSKGSDSGSYVSSSPLASPRSASSLYPPPPSRSSLLSNARDRRSWSAVQETPPDIPPSDLRAPVGPARATSLPSRALTRTQSVGSKFASAESSRASTPNTSQSQIPLAPDDGTPFSDPTTEQGSIRAPPSAFHFPFQAHPGNPDPGLSIPGAGYHSRRASMESLQATSSLIAPSPPRRSVRAPSPYSSYPIAERGSWDHDLGPPHPPFMAQGNGSQPSRNGDSPTPGSSASFRPPFLSPASRRSSVWFPPSHVANTPNPLTPNSLYAASEVPLKALRASTLLSEKLTKEDKPWLTQPPDARTRASRWITLFMIFLGACGAGIICWSGYREAGNMMIEPNRLCKVMEDNFDNFDVDNGGTWMREVEMSGFGNGEFEMATALSDNSFVRNGQLYIKPTLTSNVLSNPQQIFDGGNYTLQGCTTAKTNASACSASSSDGTGATIPPVMSARLTTRSSYSIRFGKVEVVAKLPRGDWLWPAIWMLPVNSVYGPWPLSGEIDIMEARGNGPSYPGQGVNFVRSALNWGPLQNVIARLYGWQSLKRSNYAQGFHTYTLEWTENFIKIYVDSRLRNMVDLQINSKQQSNGGFFWKRGNFPLTAHNNTAEQIVVPNPWTTATAKSATNAAPFDQAFYLILNLAVGGTSGWFPDKVGNKPWFDDSVSAMRDFASQQSTWSATWPRNEDDLSFRIDSVRMWNLC